MKKTVIFFFISLVCVAILSFLINNWLQGFETPGYVLIGLGHWSIETTLAVFTIGLIITFFVLYYCFRGLGWLIRLPARLKKRGKTLRFNRSQEALIAGLVDSAEGNFEKAEQVLIRHASHSGAPLLHYLTAARAAQSRGAIDKRDEYLRKAAAQAPESGIAIGLTQAELHLSGNEFEQALETLTKLNTMQPGHASVLKLLHQTYQRIGDWEGLRKIIPSLHTNKVLMEAEIKLLETEAFSQLLKKSAETGDIETIQQRWAEVPNYIRKMPGISAIYFAAMINSGAGALIEDELTLALSIQWDTTLLALFGDIPSDDPEKQLAMAERWLDLHPDDAILLAVLGKLSHQCQHLEKAIGYLKTSIEKEPTVQAYQLLGDLYAENEDKDLAVSCYKNGLELASSEIVKHIDAMAA